MDEWVMPEPVEPDNPPEGPSHYKPVPSTSPRELPHAVHLGRGEAAFYGAAQPCSRGAGFTMTPWHVRKSVHWWW